MSETKSAPPERSVMDYISNTKHHVANMEASEFFFLLMECRIL